MDAAGMMERLKRGRVGNDPRRIRPQNQSERLFNRTIPSAPISRRLRCDIYQQEHGGWLMAPRGSFIASFVIVPPQTGTQEEPRGERVDTLFP